MIRLLMDLALIGLAAIGGYSVAGWIGVIVVVTFVVTLIADMAIRLRTPRARAMRQLARELRERGVGEDAEFMLGIEEEHICGPECEPEE